MILLKLYCVFLSFLERETISGMFWLTHCRFGLFVVFLTFRVNFFNTKTVLVLLFSSLVVLTVVPYSSLCKRGVVLSCLKPAGTEIK